MVFGLDSIPPTLPQEFLDLAGASGKSARCKLLYRNCSHLPFALLKIDAFYLHCLRAIPRMSHQRGPLPLSRKNEEDLFCPIKVKEHSEFVEAVSQPASRLRGAIVRFLGRFFRSLRGMIMGVGGWGCIVEAAVANRYDKKCSFA